MNRAAWIAIAALASLICVDSGATEAFRPLRVGEAVPAYAVATLKGGIARLGPHEPLTLVNVWATWCGPCRQEFPELQGLHQTYGPRGLRVLAVSIDQDADAHVRSFVATQHATFVVGHDSRGDIRRALQTVGVPETFLVGRDGTLLWRKSGALRGGAADARAVIEQALAGSHATTPSR